MIINKRFAAVVVLGIAAATGLFAVRSSQAGIAWPPQLEQPFPDIEWVDQTGNAVKMSSFKGKVIFVEYVGMTCPACQAFTGAHDRGSFEKVRPQQGLDSIEKLFPQYAGGVSLDDEGIVFVQILLYNMSMEAPTTDDAKKWAEHFQLDRSKGQVVLAGKPQLLGQASYDLIPGFQLVDKNFIVRSDSTGHNPRHNLYTELLPMVPTMLQEPAATTATGHSAANLVPSLDNVFALADDKTIKAAYRNIPHRRTVYDVNLAKMSADEKNYLDTFFRLVDLAIVERVETTQWIASGGPAGENRSTLRCDP